MEYDTFSHLYADSLVQQEGLREEFEEIIAAVVSISDDDIRTTHELHFPRQKSISKAIHHLIGDRLRPIGWNEGAPIFRPPEFRGRGSSRYKIDFAKRGICLEVAFTNDGYTAWNLLKPTLASEENLVDKAIETKLGVLLMATEDMKQKGGFDGSVCTMEGTMKYLKIMQSKLSVPLMLIGLRAPRSFVVYHHGSPKRADFVEI